MSSGDHLNSDQTSSQRDHRSGSGTLRNLLASQAVGGAVALIAALIAVLWVAIDTTSYGDFQQLTIGPLTLEHWAADGGLTVFFFLAGLELKREFTTGTLRDLRRAAVPITAACCGVAVPALIFVAINLTSSNLDGWAIPAPTDIAFALAALAILGRRIPDSLRLFLLTLAVVDDLIVIAIIAIAYSHSLSAAWLAGAVGLIAIYALTAKFVREPIVALALVPLAVSAWWCTLHSGIHATVAGLILALFTPVSERLEEFLAPWSAGLIVPVFALTSAGVSLGDASGRDNLLFWGICLGLVLGKPVGITIGALAARRLVHSGQPPEDRIRLPDLLGLGFLGGIGFTVALLVSDLAYDDDRAGQAKAAVLIASSVAAVIGTSLLAWGSRNGNSQDLQSPRPAG